MARNITKPSADAAVTGPVTVHQPVGLGSDALFAVQGGAPLGDALDAMALLLSTAHDVAFQVATAGGAANSSGPAWAAEHLLAMARALNRSIHVGLMEYQLATAETGRD